MNKPSPYTATLQMPPCAHCWPGYCCHIPAFQAIYVSYFSASSLMPRSVCTACARSHVCRSHWASLSCAQSCAVPAPYCRAHYCFHLQHPGRHGSLYALHCSSPVCCTQFCCGSPAPAPSMISPISNLSCAPPSTPKLTNNTKSFRHTPSLPTHPYSLMPL